MRMKHLVEKLRKRDPKHQARTNRSRSRLRLERLEDRLLLASDALSAVLVKDINTITLPSNPAQLVDVNGTLFFTVSDSTSRSLYKSDGTEGGTSLVKTLPGPSQVRGPGSSVIQRPVTGLTAVGSLLYFAVDDGTHGNELWKSDGTENGTVQVADIRPGAGGAIPATLNAQPNPGRLTNVDGTLFFMANDGESGFELWTTDGTETGTVRVADINPGASGSVPNHLTNVGGTLFFSANDGVSGIELWKTDGSEDGTVRVADINAAGSSSPANLMNVGGTVFFSANDGINGVELWKYDGTTAVTTRVADINDAGSSSPTNLMNVGGTVFFSADDGIHGVELWKTDGSEAGTARVADINPAGNSSPSDLIDVGGTLFFSANDGNSGIELWKSDGTEIGTVRVADINPGTGSSSPATLTEVGGMLFFRAIDAVHGTELWKSDGTAAGTVLVADINPGVSSSIVNTTASPAVFVTINGTLLFRATDVAHGAELWKSDGSAAGTMLVKDINANTHPGVSADPVEVGNTVFFAAADGVHGRELWKSDGTPAGTVLVADIQSGTLASNPTNLTHVDGTLFFTASDSVHGGELWKSDGTEAGTVLVTDIVPGLTGSNPSNLTDVGGTLFFTASGPEGLELWTSDGTAIGTALVADVNPGSSGSGPSNLTNVGGTLFFTAYDAVHGTELWKSDGTLTGTMLVTDVIPGLNGSSPSNLTNVDGKLFFTAFDDVHGLELWKSDGTPEGTMLVLDINPGAVRSDPSSLTNVNGTLFFTADDGTHGRELWKSDGTPDGTSMVADIVPGSETAYIGALAALGDTLFFSAVSNDVDRLWKSDGTAAGTKLVVPDNPAIPSFVASVGVFENRLYFEQRDDIHGATLWASDGSEAGTELVAELGLGSPYNAFGNGTLAGGTFFFAANQPRYGRELWRLNHAPVATPDSVSIEKSQLIVIDVLANDSDQDENDVLSVATVNGIAATIDATITLPTGALLTLTADGRFSYDPNGQFVDLMFGQQAFDSFTYTATDEFAETTTTTVEITVNNSLSERPDLATTSANIHFSPLNPAVNETVTISATITNAGFTAAGGFTVEFRDFGQPLGSVTVAGLAAGASTTVSVSTSFADEGSRLISVVADSDALVSETKEQNNEAAAVLQVGQPQLVSGLISVAANALTVYAGMPAVVSGTAFYDFPSVEGTNDFPVQGGIVSVEVLDAATLQVLTTYHGAHTTVNGDFGQGILAPFTAGDYLLRVTATDLTATGFDLATLTVLAPIAPPPFVPPLPTDPPPPQPTVEGTIEVSGGGVPGLGGGAVTGSSIYENVFVYAEHVFFSKSSPDLGEEIYVFAYINYTGSNDSMSPFAVDLNDIVPVAGALQSFTVATTTVAFAEGAADSPQVVVMAYTNTVAGAHIMQIDTSPPVSRNVSELDDDATRLLFVGAVDGTLDAQKAATLLADADSNGVVSPGDTLRYTLIITNSSATAAEGVFVTDAYDERLAGVAFNITGGGTPSGGAVTWSGLSIPAAGSISLTYDLTVSSAVDQEAILANLVVVGVNDTSLNYDSSRVRIYVNEAPVANAGADLAAGEGATVQFDGTGSSDPNGDALAYAWDFGDGTTGTGQSPTHVYTDNGTYTVTLTVDDGRGLTDSDVLTVIVANVAPTATLSNNGAVNEGSSVTVSFSSQFDPSSVDTAAGFLYSYDLGNDGDFNGAGDLQNVTDAFASFTFDAPGTYPVRARITDKDGGWSEYVTSVTVHNLVDLSGRVFADRNNNGLFDGTDEGLEGVTVELFDEADLATPIATRVTAGDGSYLFDVKLGPGSYRIVETQPTGWLDGKETAGALGGTVDNTQDSNVISGIVVAAGDPDADGYNFANIPPARIQGLVWEDFNNDGEVNFGESAIEGVAIRLTGTDDWGAAVDRTMNTDANGIYEFSELRPGNYAVHETQPAGYSDGLDVLGTINGITAGSNAIDDLFTNIDFLNRPGADAVNYNFGERPEAGSEVHAGQTATIGFWQNKNGQSLIRSLNGGSQSTQLGNWLAATFSNLYGNLAGMSNEQIAGYFVTLFKQTNKTSPGGPPKVDAQALAVAFAVYVTNETLAGTAAAAFGFQVTQYGLGNSTFNVGTRGAAFGVADGTVMTVLDILLAANTKARQGLLYDVDGDGEINSEEAGLRALANEVFSSINQQGHI